MIEPAIQYCPYCGWDMEGRYFKPGNNGLVEVRYCQMCGEIADAAGLP